MVDSHLADRKGCMGHQGGAEDAVGILAEEAAAVQFEEEDEVLIVRH